MTEDVALESIFERFRAMWHVAQPLVTFQIENEFFDEPALDQAWARCTVVHATGVTRSMGGSQVPRIVEYPATIYVQLFAPLDEGRKRIALLGKTVKAIYNLKRFGPVGDTIITGVTTPGEGGSEGRWYMCTYSTPCRYYERG